MAHLLILTALTQLHAGAGKSTLSVSVGSTTYAYDRYLPAGQPPFPVMALGHGFSNSKDNVAGLATTLMTRGVLVVAPQFPFLSGDHATNALVMLAAIDDTAARGLADPTRAAVGGHSAGGLSAWLAAARRPALKAVVLLDAVDTPAGLGVAQSSNVTVPTLFLFAEPSSCNTQRNSAQWLNAQINQRERLTVSQATHCDPQEPSSTVCTLGCPGWAATRSALFKRYAVAFIERELLAQPVCLAALAQSDGAAVKDVGLHTCSEAHDAGTIDGGEADAGPSADAGTQPGTDGGSVDAGGAIDAGQDSDAGAEDGGVNLDGGSEFDAGSCGGDQHPLCSVAPPCHSCTASACDAGTCTVSEPPSCSCHFAPTGGLVLAVLWFLKRRHRGPNAAPI